jgi:hypothetical protein
VEVDYDATEIADAVRDQVRRGPYERDELFGDGSAGLQIAEILSAARPTVQKQLSYDQTRLRQLALTPTS